MGIVKTVVVKENDLSLLAKNVAHWKQRAKNFWLHDGDMNTLYSNFILQIIRSGQCPGRDRDRARVWNRRSWDRNGIETLSEGLLNSKLNNCTIKWMIVEF